MSATARDCWADWLCERRFGGDPDVARRFLDTLAKVRDRVLERAGVRSGETLVDVGCGDGLIGFGGLDLVGPDGEVVFVDVSRDLLEESRARAEQLGALDRCRFVEGDAAALPLPDASADVVTTRSVLIYVKDKATAFREFHRVLRPGGRISLYEPINRFYAECLSYDLSEVAELEARVRAIYDAIQPPGEDPMVDFDERDLLRLAEEAGFFPLDLEYHAEIRPIEPSRWETFLNQAGNPKIPTFGEAIEQALTTDERERLTAVLRPLVEQGRGVWRMAHAYLRGVKPPE